MMKKRQLILNDYRTAEDGLFTLSACKITKAAQEQTFVKVPGRFAPLDLSTVLTDGQPYYGNAKLDAVLESSEGTRAERQERIEHLKNLLDGQIAKIVHPDFPGRYMVGRVEVIPDFNGLAYCSVALSAVLEPWLYNNEETQAVSVLPYYEPYENLIPYPYSETTKTENGITFTDNGDGSITINGTATAQAQFVVMPMTSAYTNKAVCVSGGKSSQCQFVIINYDGDGNFYDSGQGVTATPPGVIALWIVVSGGATVNTTVYPTFNEGDTPAPFKPAKNLFDFKTWKEMTNTVNGTASFGDNYVTIYATAVDAYVLSGHRVPVKGGETYTISFDESDTTIPTVHYLFKNGEVDASMKQYYGSPYTFTADADASFYTVRFGVSDPGDTVTFANIMITPGKAAAPYVPFVNAGGENLFRAELGGDGYLASGFYDELEVIDANTITGIPKAGQGSDYIRFAQKYPPGVYTLRNKGRDPRQMFWLFDADGNNISAQHQSSFGVPYNSYYDGFYSPGEELIVTIPNSVAYWRFGVFFQPYGGNKVTLSEIQVSRGEGTPYEPTYPLGDERLTLTNGGKLAVVPVVEVEGEVTLAIGNTSRAMSTGSYLLPELYLTPGEHKVQCSGTGTAKITYREAVLAG